ncbi:hypothetical protein Tco_0655983 [Tanacetum coccineum]|uniref:Uncharacterized protein n=1 Tax=Tanacetum coccineum TaxID=301880 RepID=A0ABQ4X7J5_9ASTR
MVVRSDCCGGGEGGEVMWRGGSGGDDEVVVMVDRGDVRRAERCVERRLVAGSGGWWSRQKSVAALEKLAGNEGYEREDEGKYGG